MPTQKILVRHIMTEDIVHVPLDTSIQKVAAFMTQNRVGSVLVSEGDNLVGILTETDIVHKAVAQDLDTQIAKAESIMSFPFIGVDVEETIDIAAQQMIQNGIRHLTVTDEGKIIGILSLRDLILPLQAVKENPGHPE